MKKSLFFVIPIILILIFSNVYWYNTTMSINSQVATNNELRNNVRQIEELRLNISSLSSTAKYYLLTGDIEYKVKYKNILDESFSLLNTLKANDSISLEEVQTISDSLNKYKALPDDYVPLIEPTKEDDDFKITISNINELESSISTTLSSSMLDHINSMDVKADSITTKTDKQLNISQVLSTLLTALLSIPVYFIRKLGSTSPDIIKNVIDTVNTDIATVQKSYDENNTNIQVSDIESKLVERSILLSYLKAIYGHNEYMQSQWTQASVVLKALDEKIDSLINEISQLKEYSTLISSQEIESINDDINSLQCLFEQLPNYHTFVMDFIKTITIQ